MRSLSANALAKIASTHGNEPITIIEIDWIEDDGSKLYADRNIENISGKILEVGDLDNVINISENDSSQELSLTLDDTDGTIKAILDTNDIHKRSARVYQWFEGMGIDDRFLLFAGKISSPVTWSERQRTISFTIISQLEDKEVGFSAEEGQFPWIPKDLIGKPWPMIFGTVQDVPCLQFNKAVKGTTLCGVGIISGEDAHMGSPAGGNDSAFQVQMSQMHAQIQHLFDCSSAICGGEKYEEQAKGFNDQAQQMASQRNKTFIDNWKSKKCAQLQRAMTLQNAISEDEKGGLGCNPVRILGGEDFPQNVGLKIQIGQGTFSGHFEGSEFFISDRVHVDNESKIEEAVIAQDLNMGAGFSSYRRNLYALRARVDAYSSYLSTVNFKLPITGEDYRDPEESWDALCAPFPPTASWNLETKLPCSSHGWPRTIKSAGFAVGSIPNDETGFRPTAIAQHYWADAGSSVSVSSDEPITYVASIIPGTVLAVKAYRTFEHERLLVNVPDDLYEVESVDYGPVSAVQITVNKPLSTISEQGWEDTLYVTFESNIGPHTCDILQYIIDDYTDLEYDTTSFTAIHTKLDPFPMNFPILDKKNALDVLQEIAFQARCALWLSNGTFYIKYLPEEPTSDQTITVSDIDAEEGLTVELTSTEDLITRMNVEWRISWNEDEPDKIILRHNVKKYGTQAEDFFFYCFNQPDIVLKAATFWLIRKSNTWKKVRFKAYLQLLNLEVFDTVLLSLSSDYVSTGNVKAIVDEASYNSDDQTINFTVSTPIKSGTMVEYEFFWPSQVAVTEKFPTDFELENGYAGGDGIGIGAEGDLPIGYTDPDDWGSGVVWVGGPNVVFTGPADHGDSTPSDIGFVAQPVIFEEMFVELSNVRNPDPDLSLNYRNDTVLPDIPGINVLPYIDLHTTPIIDSSNDDSPTSTLSSFFKSIGEDEDEDGFSLIVDCDNSKWTNEDIEEGGKGFDFKYDENTKKFGAGTAWLQDDSEEDGED